MNKGILAGVIAMALIVTASNILVQFLFGNWLTWGAFTYPFTFLVTDLMNRFYGPAAARRVVWVGFAVGLVCSAIGTQIEGPFGPYVTTRIAIASGTAFLVAQMVDVGIFNQLRHRTWWHAPFVSGIFASAVDTALFFSLAFSMGFAWIAPGVDVAWANEVAPILGVGAEAPLWVSLAIADYMVKATLAVVALIPFRIALDYVRARA